MDINDYAVRGDLAGVQRLVAEGVSVDLIGNFDYRPIMIASANGRLAVVEYLISANANVNAHDATSQVGNTALQYASLYGHPAIVKVLLNAGADPSLKDEDGKTAEELAVENNHSACAQAIREHIERGDGLGPKAAHFTGAV